MAPAEGDPGPPRDPEDPADRPRPDAERPGAPEDAGETPRPTSGARSTEAHGRHRAEVRRRPLGTRRRRRRRAIVLSLLAVLLVVIGVGAWYEFEAHPLGGAGPSVVVDVTKGESAGSVYGALERQGVIGSAFAFRLNSLIHGTPTIEPGGYELRQNESFDAVRSALSAGPNVLTVTIEPGYTLTEVAKLVGQLPGHTSDGFLAAAKSGAVSSPWLPAGQTSLEGLLGAGSYEVRPKETDEELLVKMVDRFNATAAQAGLTAQSAAALQMTPYEVITAASIVQKEGYLEKNMPQVARVIYNRLAKGTPLQMDSTVLYSIGQDGGPVTAADLKINSPYNTYLYRGLTPTPICFPSEAALRAAVSPPAGNWLFFVVVQKDGTEAFSDTFDQQLANEQLAKSRGLG